VLLHHAKLKLTRRSAFCSCRWCFHATLASHMQHELATARADTSAVATELTSIRRILEALAEQGTGACAGK
jgi:hypothetical protein